MSDLPRAGAEGGRGQGDGVGGRGNAEKDDGAERSRVDKVCWERGGKEGGEGRVQSQLASFHSQRAASRAGASVHRSGKCCR